MNDKGYIHSIETAGMVDGPGIRYIIFFQGCPLRCLYCHNPDTWKMGEGKIMTVDELISDILLYQNFLKFSGGGVTITGGDPIAQPKFLLSLLSQLRKNGVHTALDTAGYTSYDTASQVLKQTDLLLLDIKSIDPTTFKRVAGVDIDLTLQFLKLADELNVPTWIRFVLVPQLTENEEHMHIMVNYLRQFKNIEKIEVLPFHKMGEYKWQNMGLTYTLANTQPPSYDSVEKAKKILGCSAIT